MQPGHDKKKEAVSAMIKIAGVDAAVVAAVLIAYFATGKLSYLIGGLIGAQIVVAPMFIGWAREHAPAMKAPSREEKNR